MKKRHKVTIVTLLLGLALGVVLLATAPTNLRSGQPENATLLPEPRALQPFALEDVNGSEFDRDDLLGRWTLMFFGFTHCPDICPVTLQQLVAARRELESQGLEKLPAIVFVTVDPQRDTRQAMAEYVANFGAAVRGVRGEPTALAQLASQLGIFSQTTGSESEDYQVNHSTAVLLINPRAELHAIFSTPHSVPALVHDIPLAMNLS